MNSRDPRVQLQFQSQFSALCIYAGGAKERWSGEEICRHIQAKEREREESGREGDESVKHVERSARRRAGKICGIVQWGYISRVENETIYRVSRASLLCVLAQFQHSSNNRSLSCVCCCWARFFGVWKYVYFSKIFLCWALLLRTHMHMLVSTMEQKYFNHLVHSAVPAFSACFQVFFLLYISSLLCSHIHSWAFFLFLLFSTHSWVESWVQSIGETQSNKIGARRFARKIIS